MAMTTKLYGASDDLVIMEGTVEDEHDCYLEAKEGVKFSASDGTKGVIKFSGSWSIDVHTAGSQVTLHLKHTDPEPHELKERNSDVLIFTGLVKWFKVDGLKFNTHIYPE